MILATARTGSNLLLSLLSSHPAIKTYGELFKLDVLPDDSLSEAMDDPVAYLQRRLDRCHGPDVAAAGFKMFYYHLTDDYIRPSTDPFYALHHMQDPARRVSSLIDAKYDWPTLRARFSRLWQVLGDDRELAIISLRRRNMLETLVSITTAFKTKRWWSHSGRPAVTMVHLDPEQCLACFQKLEALAAEADQRFGRHRKLELFYEDLVQRRDETLTRVSGFLGVAIHPASTRLNKLVNVPPSACIDNYAELKDFFRGSRWTEFFS